VIDTYEDKMNKKKKENQKNKLTYRSIKSNEKYDRKNSETK
jgi:hypothetical protein